MTQIAPESYSPFHPNDPMFAVLDVLPIRPIVEPPLKAAIIYAECAGWMPQFGGTEFIVRQELSEAGDAIVASFYGNKYQSPGYYQTYFAGVRVAQQQESFDARAMLGYVGRFGLHNNSINEVQFAIETEIPYPERPRVPYIARFSVSEHAWGDADPIIAVVVHSERLAFGKKKTTVAYSDPSEAGMASWYPDEKTSGMGEVGMALARLRSGELYRILGFERCKKIVESIDVFSPRNAASLITRMSKFPLNPEFYAFEDAIDAFGHEILVTARLELPEAYQFLDRAVTGG